MNSRPRRAAATLAALVLGFATGSAPARAGDMVDDDRGPVHLKTDLSAKADRDAVHALAAETRDRVAAELERFGVRRKSKGLTRMRVYASRDGFEDRKRKTTPDDMHWASAFFDEANNEVVMWWADGSRSGRETLRHEVTHQVLAEFVKNAPIWFDEGFASYIGAVEVDAHGDPITLVDEKKIQRMRHVLRTGEYAPLYDLMDMKWLEFFGKAGTKKLQWDRATMYAQSWSLVYFLLNAVDPADRELAEKLAERVDTGRWSQAAFKRMLPELESRWRAFLERDDLIAADGHARAAWSAWTRRDATKAAEEAKAALAIDPERRAMSRVLAEASLAAGAPADAVPVFRALLEAGESEASCFGLASALLALAAQVQDGAIAEEARDAALRAAELAPRGRGYDALVLAADACEQMGDADAALGCVRKALAEKAIPAELRSALREREQALVRRVISGG